MALLYHSHTRTVQWRNVQKGIYLASTFPFETIHITQHTTHTHTHTHTHTRTHTRTHTHTHTLTHTHTHTHTVTHCAPHAHTSPREIHSTLAHTRTYYTNITPAIEYKTKVNFVLFINFYFKPKLLYRLQNFIYNTIYRITVSFFVPIFYTASKSITLTGKHGQKFPPDQLFAVQLPFCGFHDRRCGVVNWPPL